MVFPAILAIAGIVLAGFLIQKKVNATVALFIGGLLILMFAPLLGYHAESVNSGNPWLNQFGMIGNIFASTTQGIGMTIMLLFGFSAYMTHIGANQMATDLLTRPLLGLKMKYLLIPLVFWIGNLMSLAVPSASALAVLLVATVLPAMVAAGINPLAAAAVIATTATIMPTPLGADNIIASERLGIDLGHYVFGMHALISIPTLIVMGLVHFFWQRYMDRRDILAGNDLGTMDLVQGNSVDGNSNATVDANGNVVTSRVPNWYALLPILPLLLVLIPFLLRTWTPINLNVGLPAVTFLSLMVAVVAQLIRTRDWRVALEDMMVFFKGMGTGFGAVVALVIAANILVEAIIQIGVVAALSNAVAGMHSAALILFLGFTGAMLLLSLLTGGIAPFYSLVEIAPEVATQTGVNGALLILPMQFVGNLARAMSPVAAVVLIVASAVKVNVGRLIARTAVPMIVGILMSVILTWIVVGA